MRRVSSAPLGLTACITTAGFKHYHGRVQGIIPQHSRRSLCLRLNRAALCLAARIGSLRPASETAASGALGLSDVEEIVVLLACAGHLRSPDAAKPEPRFRSHSARGEIALRDE